MARDPLEFSRLGDEHFGGLAAKLPGAVRRRLLLVHDLDPDRFLQIRTAAAIYASACLGAKRPWLDEGELIERLVFARGRIPNHDGGGCLAPKREHTVEFNQLHKSVAAAFSDLGLEGLVDGIDLPINLRMVYGERDKERARLPFSSAKLHSDVWAGVPYDAVVVVLPVFGDIENLTIEVGEMPREDEMAWMRALPDYSEGRVKKVVAYEGDAMRHGQVYFADARCLHQTVRRKREGVRLSVDFRFRMRAVSPYRTLLPEAHGVDSMTRSVPYERWLGVGTRSLIAFTDSVHDRPRIGSASPIETAEYRTLDVEPPARLAAAG